MRLLKQVLGIGCFDLIETMKVARDWKDYELLDAGDGEKLERWGAFVLRRPDPQALWPKGLDARWESPDARYRRSREGGGSWESSVHLPNRWTISYRELVFSVECMGFKHTGIFPEQAVNWDWMREKIRGASKPVRLLNLFAYTGAATVAALSAGAEVCHVDSSKGMVERAKENVRLSGLQAARVRYIVDDAMKFVEREKRRGHTYDAIVLDPPSFGRGPKGEIWKVEEQLFSLLQRSTEIVSKGPLFVLVNSYTAELSPIVIRNMLALTVGKKFQGNVSSSEIGLSATLRKDILLPCGSSGYWE